MLISNLDINFRFSYVDIQKPYFHGSRWKNIYLETCNMNTIWIKIHLWIRRLTQQQEEPEKPTTTHTGKACIWIWREHQPEGSDAPSTHTEGEAAKQSQGGNPSRILQYGQNYQHLAEFQGLGWELGLQLVLRALQPERGARKKS